MDPCPSRRLGILFPVDLHSSSPRRLQPSIMDALRLPLPAAQDEHRHCFAYLLHRVAHRNGSVPIAQRAPPRGPSPCILDGCVHDHLPRLGYRDVVCVHPALLERYCAKSGHVGYVECCGFDYQLRHESYRSGRNGQFVCGGYQRRLVPRAFRVDSADIYGAVVEC